jgi:hypothetical protein
MKNKKSSKQQDPANIKNAGFPRNERAQTGYLNKKGLNSPLMKPIKKKDC